VGVVSCSLVMKRGFFISWQNVLRLLNLTILGMELRVSLTACVWRYTTMGLMLSLLRMWHSFM
jgi:hypothetical protein